MDDLSVQVFNAATSFMLAAALQAAGLPAADAWSALWRRVSLLAGQVEALNLDRADAFWSLLAEIGSAVRRFGPIGC